MAYGDEYTPVALERGDDDTIRIRWADGAETVYPMDLLRAKCPCAGCVDEFTGKVLVSYDDVKGTRVKKIDQVGTYAFSIAFSDGHATGIFTFKMLRNLGQEIS